MIIAIDFDGTCVTHEFPNIGRDIGAARVLKRLIDNGHQLMLWTMRSNKLVNGINTLQEAVDWFKNNEIALWGINQNSQQKVWSDSKKQYANLYIDDAALGCPLTYDYETVDDNGKKISVLVGRPYVDWAKIEKLLEIENILSVNKN